MENLLIALFFAILVFFVCRELLCWYWKVNERLELQKRMADDLTRIRIALEGNTKSDPPVNRDIAEAYRAIKNRVGPSLTQGQAKLELEKQGFSTSEIADFLDTL